MSPFWARIFKEIIDEITSDHFCAYPETGQLHDKISEHINVDQKNLVITAGADSAIRHCFDLFVNPCDKVICLEPTFAMVDVYCKLYNANKFNVSYNNRLNLDISNIIEAVDEKTSLIIIANPNSPTGTILNLEELRQVLLAAQAEKVPVLIDEAYFEFSNFSALPLLNEFENLIISRTFSKAFGLAGLRIGFLIANEILAKLLFAFKPMYEVNQIAVQAASKALDNYNLIRIT